MYEDLYAAFKRSKSEIEYTLIISEDWILIIESPDDPTNTNLIDPFKFVGIGEL